MAKLVHYTSYRDDTSSTLKVTKHFYFNKMFAEPLNGPDLHLQKIQSYRNVFYKIKCVKISLKSAKI